MLLDENTGEPIPFVNICAKNKNLGTSSSLNGYFAFNEKPHFSDTLVFSAVGYFEHVVQFKNLSDTVKMMPRIYQMNEIVVNNRVKKRQLWIGSFLRRKINLFYTGSANPQMMAGFFPYDAKYSQTPYLKGVEMFVKNELENVKVNIRLFKPDSVGFPGEYVFYKPLFLDIQRGKHLKYLDLSKLGIVFPPEGIFVAVEWIVIPENRYDRSYFDKKTLQNKTIAFYQPEIGVIPLETNELTFMYSGGEWRKIWKHQSEVLLKYKNKYPFPAFRILLTN